MNTITFKKNSTTGYKTIASAKVAAKRIQELNKIVFTNQLWYTTFAQIEDKTYEVILTPETGQLFPELRSEHCVVFRNKSDMKANRAMLIESDVKEDPETSKLKLVVSTLQVEIVELNAKIEALKSEADSVAEAFKTVLSYDGSEEIGLYLQQEIEPHLEESPSSAFLTVNKIITEVFDMEPNDTYVGDNWDDVHNETDKKYPLIELSAQDKPF